MSGRDSEAHDSGSNTEDSENAEDTKKDSKADSDPRLLFRRPRQKRLLRPGCIVMTKMDGSRLILYDNPDNDPNRQDDSPDSDPNHNDPDPQYGNKDGAKDPRSKDNDTVNMESLQRKEDVSEADSSRENDPQCDSNPQRNRYDPYVRRFVARQGRLQQESPEETSDPDTEDEKQADSESDSEFYDTDLDQDTTVAQMFEALRPPERLSDDEIEDDDDDDEDEDKPDMVKRKDYLRLCHKQRAVPQSAILRNLGNRDLDLRHRNVGTKHLKPLFATLKDNMRVQRLLLDENGLDEEAAECLATGLRDNVTVTYLSLSGNPLGSQGVAHVVQLLQTNKMIQGLDLSDTKLGRDSVLLLSHLIKMNMTLKFLDLSRNTLEEDLIRFLAAAIGENCRLEFLRLSWNNIRHSGAAAIGQCITVNEYLRVLDLSWNGFGYEGAVAIGKSLKENETLEELNISHNNINWQGALILSSALAKNSTLKILRAGGNPITTTGANDLVEASSSATCELRLLDISNVPVIFDTEMLASSISQNRPFRLHHGGVVFIHDSIGRRLERERKPMERLLGHLKEKMIRPLEMLRDFDKQNTGRVTQTEFMTRLKKVNVPLHGFEVRALAASVSDIQQDGSTAINYKKLIDGVERHMLVERMRKIKNRIYEKRVREYHKRILRDNEPLYSHALSDSLEDSRARDYQPWNPLSSMSTDRLSLSMATLLTNRDSSRSLLSVGKLTESQVLPSVTKTTNTPRKTFTLSQPLGEIGVKTKKKKKSKVKKGKRSKAKEKVAREAITLVSSLQSEEISAS